MAELGLAIAGVAATGAALSKSLYSLYQSARDAYKEARDVALRVKLLKDVLRQLRKTVARCEDVYTIDLETDIRDALSHSREIFRRIDALTSPLVPRGQQRTSDPSMSQRVRWHFRKGEVRVLQCQLDGIATAVNLMISIIALNRQLSADLNENDQPNARVSTTLRWTSQLVSSGRTTLTNLAIVEDTYFAELPTPDVGSTSQRQFVDAQPLTGEHLERIADWLRGVVRFSEGDRASGRSQSSASHRSNVTLSTAQRRIVGDASGEVELLLDKWTTASESRSRISDCDMALRLSSGRMTSPVLSSSSPSSSSESSEDSDAESSPDFENDSVDSEVEMEVPVESLLSSQPELFEAEASPRHSVALHPSPGVLDDADGRNSGHHARVDSGHTPIDGHLREMLSQGSAQSTSEHHARRFQTQTPRIPKARTITDGGSELSVRTLSSRATVRASLPAVAGETSPTPSPAIAPSWRKVPLPTALLDTGPEDQTIRDLRKVERQRRVQVAEPFEEGSTSADTFVRVRNWVIDQNGGEAPTETPSNRSTFGQSPFSELSILESVGTRAPTVMTGLSALGTADDPRRMEKLLKLGSSKMRARSYAEAAFHYREAYALKIQQGSDDDPELTEIQFRIAVIFGELKRFGSAQKLLEAVLTKQKLQLGENAVQTQLSAHYLARLYGKQKDWSKAKELYALIWNTRKDVLGDTAASTKDRYLALRSGQELTEVLLHLNLFTDALDIARRIEPAAIELKGTSDMRFTLTVKCMIGVCLCKLGQYDEAEPLLKATLHTLNEIPNPSLSIIADCRAQLASLALRAGANEEAEAHARYAWDHRTKALGDMHPFSVEAAEHLCQALYQQAKHGEAKIILSELYTKLRRSGETNSVLTLKLGSLYARSLLASSENAKAQEILKVIYKAAQQTKDNVSKERMEIAEQLAPLVMKTAEAEKRIMKKTEHKMLAKEVYKDLYESQRHVLGPDSSVTLDTGHTYGGLCFELLDLKTAERVLNVVWLIRKQTLGEHDPSSIASGYQLGQVFFWSNKSTLAIATIGSVYDLNSMVYGQSNLKTVQSMEMLGLTLISERPDQQQLQEAYDLLDLAFRTRQDAFGLTTETYGAGLRLAVLSVTRDDLLRAQDIFQWMYRNADTSSGFRYEIVKVFGGVTACALAYIRGHEEAGNRILRKTVRFICATAPLTSGDFMFFSYGRAFILFLQGRRRSALKVLYHLWQQYRASRVIADRFKHRSAEIYLMAIILDALMSRRPIPPQADFVNDWIHEQRGTKSFVMQLAVLAALFCGKLGFHEISRTLLEWVYKCKKRLYGRFKRETMEMLLVCHIQRLVAHTARKNGEQKDWTKKDPRVYISLIWPICIKLIARIPQAMKESEFFTRILPKVLAQFSFVKAAVATALRIAMAELTNPFLQAIHATNWAQIPEQATSRAWTISEASSDAGSDDDLQNSDKRKPALLTAPEGSQIPDVIKDYFARRPRRQSPSLRSRSRSRSRSSSPVMAEGGSTRRSVRSFANERQSLIGDNEVDRLSSLGASLLDFGALSDDNQSRVETDIAEMHDAIVHNNVSADDIARAEARVDDLEAELESSW